MTDQDHIARLEAENAHLRRVVNAFAEGIVKGDLNITIKEPLPDTTAESLTILRNAPGFDIPV